MFAKVLSSLLIAAVIGVGMPISEDTASATPPRKLGPGAAYLDSSQPQGGSSYGPNPYRSEVFARPHGGGYYGLGNPNHEFHPRPQHWHDSGRGMRFWSGYNAVPTVPSARHNNWGYRYYNQGVSPWTYRIRPRW